MELLPLPSPSTGHWHYAEWSALPWLRDRASYRAHYAEARVRHLRARVREHRPRAVVFAGLQADYQTWWEAIAPVPLADRDVAGRRCRVGTDGETVYVVMAHPAAWGVTNASLAGIGSLIAGGAERAAAE